MAAIDWSQCERFAFFGAEREFDSLRHLLNWLAWWGYDGHDKVTDVLAKDGPTWVLVPKNVVDRWMGVH